jgi:dynein light chain LC8-type
LSCARPIAQEIKKHLDDKWRPHWHCIIGKNFGCYATHESKKCVYFYFKDIAIMLFKT